MRRTKFSTSKPVSEVCKEIEDLCSQVLRGVKPEKEKENDNNIIYYPARRLSVANADMDGVKIMVRKVNNSLTSIKLEDEERLKGSIFKDNRRYIIPKETYDVLKDAMVERYAQ